MLSDYKIFKEDGKITIVKKDGSVLTYNTDDVVEALQNVIEAEDKAKLESLTLSEAEEHLLRFLKGLDVSSFHLDKSMLGFNTYINYRTKDGNFRSIALPVDWFPKFELETIYSIKDLIKD